MENTSRCLYFLPSALLYAYGFYLESIRYKEEELERTLAVVCKN